LLFFDEDTPGSPRYLKEMAEKKARVSSYQVMTINAYDIQVIVEEDRQDGY